MDREKERELGLFFHQCKVSGVYRIVFFFSRGVYFAEHNLQNIILRNLHLQKIGLPCIRWAIY